MNGGADRDTFFGEAGSDTITASGDGVDKEEVDCGDGPFWNNDDFASLTTGRPALGAGRRDNV